jgi:hypothetical protein
MGNLFKVRFDINSKANRNSLYHFIPFRYWISFTKNIGAGKTAFRKLHSMCGISKNYRIWRSSFHTTPWPAGNEINFYPPNHQKWDKFLSSKSALCYDWAAQSKNRMFSSGTGLVPNGIQHGHKYSQSPPCLQASTPTNPWTYRKVHKMKWSK